jgi:hypothetical protein
VSDLLLLLTGFRTKGPWPVETAALGVICACSKLYMAACVILQDRFVGGRTTRKPQQPDGHAAYPPAVAQLKAEGTLAEVATLPCEALDPEAGQDR